jgi:cell division protein ZapE
MKHEAARAAGGVRQRYEARVAAGALTADPAQRAAADALDGLAARLVANAPAKGGGFSRLFAWRKAADPVRGLYIHGGVGRGKTMLMDLFFEAAPIEAKRRSHFHVFMADVHDRIGRARAAGGGDPIRVVARDIAHEIRLVCFDEFSVTDIADAMLLGRLFALLFERGVVMVATSNVAPDDLYPDGINRDHFLPFIALLKVHCDVLRLDAATDYRLEKIGGAEVWLTPLGPTADAAMDALFARLADGAEVGPATIEVKSRKVAVPRAAGRVARFTFAELCGRPLGARDYQAIARAYAVVFVDAIPRFTPERRNEAKRFIILIDTLYDAGTKLIASAEVPSTELDGGLIRTEAFELQRTVSRLIEMRSDAYLAVARG